MTETPPSGLPDALTLDRQKTAVDAAADEYYEATLDLHPDWATIEGRTGRETEYTDFSPAGYAAQADLARRTLQKVNALEPVDAVDRVTLDVMNERLGLELEIYDGGYGPWELSNIATPAHEIRMIFDLMDQESAQGWEHVVGRMGNVGTALDQFVQTLRHHARAGRVAAARQVRLCITQFTEYAREGGFFDELAAQAVARHPVLSEPARTQAASARAGYQRLVDFLREELLPLAPAEDAFGRERYQLHSREFLGATVDLEETYAWGVEELDRIIAEEQEVAAAIRPGASIAEAKEILNQDPARKLHGTDALRSWMQRLSDQAVEALAQEHFAIEGPMRRLECMIAPTQEGGMYYTGPSSDFSRPGRMWWSVPAGETEFTTWSETSTVYHEGVPGHHLQVATSTAMAGSMNQYRASGAWCSGHGEGWALYAERLMDQLGFLSDPGDRMGMLDGQRMRAARVVFDIGLHCGFEIPQRWVEELGVRPGPWTAEAGEAFLRANLDLSEGQRDFEFNRYLGWGGQAPSYKVGQRIWEQLRDEALQRGESLKDFHTRALKVGSVGLDSLQRALSEDL